MKYQFFVDKFKNITPLEPAFDGACIPVCFSANEYYVPYLAPTIASIIEQNKTKSNIDIVIFSKDITKKTRKKFLKRFSQNNISIRFVNVKYVYEDLDFFTTKYITIEAYFRIISPLFFAKYKKFIYLDCDLLLLDDISKLYNLDIGEYPIGAIQEFLISAFMRTRQYLAGYLSEIINLKNPEKYFNSGVILFNVPVYLKNNFPAIGCNLAMGYNYRMHDQDVLNKMFSSDIYWIPYEWNYLCMQRHLIKMDTVNYMSDKIRKTYLSIKTPKIMHYAGHPKPWENFFEVQSFLWWKFALKSGFFPTITKRIFLKKAHDLKRIMIRLLLCLELI